MPSRRSRKKKDPRPTKSQLDRIRSKGIFETSLKGEQFGQHPGYVDVRIRFSVYNPISQQEERLPGKEIGLLISSIEEVDAMVQLITRTLTDWIAGWIEVTKE